MPQGIKKGPEGKGAVTGRGLGYCTVITKLDLRLTEDEIEKMEWEGKEWKVLS